MFWDDDEWISTCMKDASGKARLGESSPPTLGSFVVLALSQAVRTGSSHWMWAPVGLRGSGISRQVDKAAIDNFFVTNQWKFLLIGEEGPLGSDRGCTTTDRVQTRQTIMAFCGA